MVETVSPREQLISPPSSPTRSSPSTPGPRNYSNFLKTSAFEQIFSNNSKKLEIANFGLVPRKYMDTGDKSVNYESFSRKIFEPKDYSECRKLSPSPESEVYLRKSPSPYLESDRFNKALENSLLNFRKNNDNSDFNRSSEFSIFKSENDQLFHRDSSEDVRKSQLFVNNLNLNQSSPRSINSSFSIDSILARGSATSSQPRVPAMLHPGLHLGHLAAAAASGFGASSADFLGKFNRKPSQFFFHFFTLLQYYDYPLFT